MAAKKRRAKSKSQKGATQGPIGNTTGVYIPVPNPNTSGGVTKIPIEATTPEEKNFLEKKQEQLQGKIDDWVAAQGYGEVAKVSGALATALNQVLFPTALWELVPVGKVFKLVKKGKQATEAVLEARKVKKAEKAAEEVKAAEKSKDVKKAGDKDGGRVDPKKQKPHKDCGKVSTYNKAPKKLGELNADHVPSGAALKKAAEDKLQKLGILDKLSEKQLESVLNRVYNHAKTITVPEDVHIEGRSWGSKNKPLVDGDSKDLKGAFKKDTDAIQKSMDTKDHGCSEKYREAVKELEKFDFDKHIDDTITGHKTVAKLLGK